MKKFLSLVLALIMTMSLVTISAGAKDFTDDSKITYQEAVDVMSAVKVIDGYEDGSFNPQGNLTRGAAAKIICNLILGPTTAAALRADTAPYKDVPVNHTFAGYIAYCQQQGIISGYADGTFRPAATLTNYAFLKMLLGALGYDAITEGYVGDNWSINVAKQALAIGLTKGMVTELNGTDAATREQACLYALNTLQATMVEYVQKTTVNISGANVTLSGTIRDVEWGTGKLYDGNIEDDGFVQFAEKYFQNLELEVGHGIYGRPANTWKLKKSEIGTYTTRTPSFVFTEGTKEKDVYKELGKALFDEDDYEWEYYVNGKKVDGKQPSKTGDKDYVYTGEGTVTEIYVKDSYRRDNYGNKVDPGTVTVVEYNYYIGEVSKVKDDIITVKTLSKEAKLDDRTFSIDGFEEEDYVVFTVDYDEDEEDYIIGEVIEPETVTGDVKRVESDKNSEKSYLKMDDGEQYDYAESLTHNVYDLENVLVAEHPELNTEYTLYLDPNGYVLGFKKGDDGSKYLYVKDSDEELKDWVAKVVLSDATAAKVDLKDELKKVPSDATVPGTDPAVLIGEDIKWIDDNRDGKIDSIDRTNIDEMIWKYTASDKGVYTLTYVDAEYPTELYEINNGEAYIDPEDAKSGTAEGLIVDKKTIFVDIDGEKVYTGYDEVPNVSNAKIAYVLKKGVVEIMFIIDGDIYDKNSTYFILTSDKRESFKYDGDDYWMLKKAYVDGDLETLNVEYTAFNGPALLSDKKDDTKYWNLETGVLYKAVKSITDGDETYITKVEEPKLVTSGAPVAVGDASFQVKPGDLANVQKFTAKDTIFVLVEHKPEELKDYEKAAENGEAYTGKWEWVVSNGSINDMKEDDKYIDVTVDVVKADDQNAELVYIYQEYRPQNGKEYTVTVKADGQADVTQTVKKGDDAVINYAVDGYEVVSVVGGDYADGKITVKNVTADTTVTVTLKKIVKQVTLTMKDSVAGLITTDNATIWVNGENKTASVKLVETIDESYYTIQVDEGSEVIIKSIGSFSVGTYNTVEGVSVTQTTDRLTITMSESATLTDAAAAAKLYKVTAGEGIELTLEDGTAAPASVKQGTKLVVKSVTDSYFTKKVTDNGSKAISGAPTADTTKITVGTDDLLVYAASQVTLSNATASYKKADGTDQDVPTGRYVAVGTELTVKPVSGYAAVIIGTNSDENIKSYTVTKETVTLTGAHEVTLTNVEAAISGKAIGKYVADGQTIDVKAVSGEGTAVIETSSGKFSYTDSTGSVNVNSDKNFAAAVKVDWNGSGINPLEYVAGNGKYVAITDGVHGVAYVVPNVTLIATKAGGATVTGADATVESPYTTFITGVKDITIA